jgi:hypothetical protein
MKRIQAGFTEDALPEADAPRALIAHPQEAFASGAATSALFDG